MADGAAIRVFNQRGEMRARAHVTTAHARGHRVDARRLGGAQPADRGGAVIPDAAVDVFGFSAGQAAFDAAVEVAALAPVGAV